MKEIKIIQRLNINLNNKNEKQMRLYVEEVSYAFNKSNGKVSDLFEAFSQLIDEYVGIDLGPIYDDLDDLDDLDDIIN